MARAQAKTNANPIALVTGASSGIGEALSDCFAQAGHDLILVARSADKLAQRAAELKTRYGIRAWPIAADLSIPGAAAKLHTALKRSRRPIDVLVNNAGVLEHGAFVDMPSQRHEEIIALNVGGLSAMLAQFLPPMVARGEGRVLNVASIAAFQPIPMLATYAASKAYVLSLTESLAEELVGSGVSMTALCPGVTATPMLTGAQAGSQELTKLPRLVVGDVKDVAQQGFQACMRGDVICVPGILNQAAVVAGRATPKWLLRRMSGVVTRRMRKLGRT
jgi:uncharacterized protein